MSVASPASETSRQKQFVIQNDERKRDVNPDDINIGDKLQIKAGFVHAGSQPIDVVITGKEKGTCEGGWLFFTFPVCGSGHGIAAFWFEPICTKPSAV